MLEKIVEIKHVGKLRRLRAAGDVAFRQITLLFGANGRGKTTLCDVLRSLATGQLDYMQGRRTLGLDEEMEVDLRWSDGNVRFVDGEWSARKPEIDIFDDTFVHENVYVGPYVDAGHKRNLYRVILGSTGVGLAENVDWAEEAVANLDKEVAAAREAIEEYLPEGVDVQEFLEATDESAIDEMIETAAMELAAQEQANDLQQRPAPQALSLPRVPEDLEEILANGIDGVATDAEKLVREHLAEHGATEDWLQTGLEFASEACPYCGQNVKGLRLVEAYSAYFSDAYRQLKETVVSTTEAVEELAGEAVLLRLQQVLERNERRAEYWGRFVSVDLPDLDADDIAGELRELADEAAKLCHQKSQSLLDPVDAGATLARARSRFAPTLEAVEAYNKAVTTATTLIESKKAAVTATSLKEARRKHRSLSIKKLRFEGEGEKLAARYSDVASKKGVAQKEKEATKSALNDYTTSIVPGFEERINTLLERFGATFHIGRTAHDYRGRRPRSTYCVVINGVSVELGDPRTPLSDPSFRNTLSSGDRRTLALAFFLARAQLDKSLDSRILIVDDPFTSQDSSRRTSTQQELIRLGERALQMVVLSHERVWLHDLWKRCKKKGMPTKTLQLSRLGENNTALVEWDVEREVVPAFIERRDAIAAFVAGDSAAEAADIGNDLRILLEEFLRSRYPDAFPPEHEEWLGDYIERIRDAPVDGEIAPLKDILEELDDINDYSRQFHHADGSGQTPEGVDVEQLVTYAKRALNVVDAC